MKKILWLLPIAFLFACSNQQPGNSTNEAGAAAVETPSIEVTSEDVEIEGLYANQKITDCANRGVINVSNTQSLDSAYKALLPDAYNGLTMYAKVKGILTTKGTEKELTIKQLIQAEQKYFKNSCISYDYWCNGSEPFWSLQISEKENVIDFYDPMVKKYYHFNYSQPETKGKAHTYKVVNGSDNLSITVTEEKCNGSADMPYSYKAELMLNGKAYHGCAIKFQDEFYKAH